MKLNFAKIVAYFSIACIAVAVVSCNNSGKKSSSENGKPEVSENVIKNDKLFPFLFGGVYFMHGYGGSAETMKMIKAQMTEKAGTSAFRDKLSSSYDELFIFPFKTSEGADARKTLTEWWDIHNKEDMKKTQEDLLVNGHQKKYEKVRKALDENGGANADVKKINLSKYGLKADDEDQLEFVKANYTKFSPAGIKAWDYMRYVNNLCMAYAAGYFDEKESLEILNKVVPAAQKDYSDWKTYFNDWNLGRGFWGGDKSESFDKDIEELNKPNDYNIYNYMPLK